MEFDKVKEIIAAKVEIDPELITLESSFEGMQVDSLDMVEIVMDIEDAFDITIEAGDDIKTVGDLLSYIQKAN